MEPDTGVPGDVGGESARRVLRAPADGIFRSVRAIGDRVRAGEVVAYVDDTPVLSRLDGVLRGLLHDGLTVRAGVKVGDVDPGPSLPIASPSRIRRWRSAAGYWKPFFFWPVRAR